MKKLPLHIQIAILLILSIALVGLTSSFVAHQMIKDLLYQAPLLEEKAAKLHTGLNKTSLQREAEQARSTILVIILITTLVIASASVIWSLRITLSLRKFSEAIATYGSGLPTLPLEVAKGGADVQSLAESFNRMLFARQETERELVASEERFRTLTENSSDWIWEFDENEIFTYASPRIKELLGYEPEEVIGKSAFDIIPPEDAKVVRQEFAVLKENREPFFSLENTNQHNDGHLVILESSGVPFFDTDGHFKGYRGIDRDITDRKNAEKELSESLSEKEILLKEIYHRVKNNMQIISSLLYLQAEKIDNSQAQTILLECQNRVKSMALIHETLYSTGNMANIDFTAYLSNLTQNISTSYNNASTVNFIIEAPEIMLPIDKAIPCGLIVNELLTNCLKHAFPKGQGEISIKLFCPDDTITLIVKDSGIGFKKDQEQATSNSLGMTLIDTLATQLNASLVFETLQGVKCTIAFKV